MEESTFSQGNPALCNEGNPLFARESKGNPPTGLNFQQQMRGFSGLFTPFGCISFDYHCLRNDECTFII